MVDIALNPYFDAVLREHVVRAAETRGLEVRDLEALLRTEGEALEFLKGCGVDLFEAYVEDASAAVDHVGWVVTPRRPPKANP